MIQAVSEWKISTARRLITKILSGKISVAFRAVCCCAQGVCMLRKLGRKQKTRHAASLKCKHTMGFDLFRQTAFLGKFSLIHRKCCWKNRTGYCQTQDTSLSKARGKYLFCFTLEVMWLGIVPSQVGIITIGSRIYTQVENFCWRQLWQFKNPLPAVACSVSLPKVAGKKERKANVCLCFISLPTIFT